MFMAGGAVDRRLESEGGYLAERREGQRVERPARLERAGVQWRINFLPAVLMPAVLARYPCGLLQLAFVAGGPGYHWPSSQGCAFSGASMPNNTLGH